MTVPLSFCYRRVIRLFLATGLLASLAACRKPPTVAAPPAATTSTMPARVVPGTAAAALALPPMEDLDAKQLQALIASYRGKQAVLVNVWATWCAPCVEEFPLLMELAKAHPDVHFIFISADFASERDAARAFLAKQGLATLSYHKQDDTQDFFPALAPEWDGALPATVVLHRDGHRVIFFADAAVRATLEASLRAATATASAP